MAFERQMPRSLSDRDALFGSVLESRRPVESPAVPWGRWAGAGLALVMVASVAVGIMRHRDSPAASGGEKSAAVARSAATTNAPARSVGGNAVVQPKPAAVAPRPPSAAARQARRWLDGAANRSREERVLLERLANAELAGNMRIAIDSIEQLRKRPTMADIDDALARRLGALNVAFILSGQPTQWTAEVALRKNDTPFLVARRHGTTVEAVRRLNNLKDAHAFPPSMRKARVLEFPRASLVVRKRSRVADLTLNGNFFKRFYLSVDQGVKADQYPITSKPTEGPLARFKALGMRFVPMDEDELRMLLAPGAQLVVSDL